MKIKEEDAFRVLSVCEQYEGQVDLAQNLGYSVGKVNYILKALIAKGHVKMQNFASSEKKLNYRYLLTPEGMYQKLTLTESFIARKKAEYDQLQQQLEETRRRLAQQNQ